jgi:superfamily II DNA or RNA helicase
MAGWAPMRVVIPRGALSMLPQKRPLVAPLQIEQDGRSLPRMPKLGFQVELDGEGFSGQQDALKAMLREKQGLIVRQPGSGKTQIALAFIATANTPTLVVVHTNDLKQQWQEYAQRAIPSIKLGNLREPGHLTIATVQTLKRYTLNGDNFWSQWGAIVIDECHHSSANSWEWVLNVSRAYYRFGFTATERRADGREPLVQFLVGPVIHKQRFRVTGSCCHPAGANRLLLPLSQRAGLEPDAECHRG